MILIKLLEVFAPRNPQWGLCPTHPAGDSHQTLFALASTTYWIRHCPE